MTEVRAMAEAVVAEVEVEGAGEAEAGVEAEGVAGVAVEGELDATSP